MTLTTIRDTAIKVEHALVAVTDAAAVAIASVNPHALPVKYAAIVIALQHAALIIRPKIDGLPAQADAAVKTYEQLVAEAAAVPDVTQAEIAATPQPVEIVHGLSPSEPTA